MSLFAYLETLANKGLASNDFFNKFRYVSSGQELEKPIQFGDLVRILAKFQNISLPKPLPPPLPEVINANPFPDFYDIDATGNCNINKILKNFSQPIGCGFPNNCTINEIIQKKPQCSDNKTIFDWIDKAPKTIISQLKISTLLTIKGQDSITKIKASKLAIVIANETQGNHAKLFFESVVLFSQLTNMTVEVFSNEKDFYSIVKNNPNQPFFGGIVIEKFDLAENDFSFKVQYPKEDVPDTKLKAFNPLISQPYLGVFDQWFRKGQLQYFLALSEFIARYKKYENEALSNDVFTDEKPLYQQQLGFVPLRIGEIDLVDQGAINGLRDNLPNFLFFIYIIPVFYIITKLTEEKESKAREGMKMMGLKDATYYLAWIILNTTLVFIISIIVTILEYKVLNKCSLILIFILNFLYGLSFLGSILFCSAVLPQARKASIAVGLLNYLTFCMSFLLRDESPEAGLQYGLSLFPPVCMNQMIKLLFFFNFQTKDGLNFTTAYTTQNNYVFMNGLLILFIEVIVYSSLGLYLDQVIPSQFGVAKPWYFLCICKKNKHIEHLQENLIEQVQQDQRNFEQVPDSLRRQEQTNQCLKVRGLVKKFGEKTAVKGVDMTMYNGQIFALLGHNGAGKTTTISMLTGLIEPSSGQASVFGLDILNEMEDFRKVLGVCPQHDVLFDFLTPEDHLRLFASFKGTDQNLIEDQVQQMLIDIDLVVQKKQLAKTLSGGQKRKLSVAISMIGNSKIVMLDEPSSGMDTSTRRRLWEMLKKNKAGKIVILTTHYMDEADILGDRIAIMAEGEVQCTGSSLFLKNRYGVGYNLVIAKKDRQSAPQVDKFVLGNVKGAKKLQEVSSEITYQLPSESSSQFKQFFQLFDQNLDQLGIRSYSVGITTLEEVFLKIGHGEELEAAKLEQKEIQKTALQESSMSSLQSSQYQELEDYSIANDSENSQFFKHLYQIMRKKVLMQFRDKKTLVIDMFFPNLLIIFGLVLSTITFFTDGVPRNLSPEYLFENNPIYYNTKSSNLPDSEISNFINNYIRPENTSFFQNNSNDKFMPELQDKNLSQQCLQLDEFAFNQANLTGQRASAAFYIQDLNRKTEVKNEQYYSAIIFVNATAREAVPSYASFMSTIFLKKYLNDSGYNNTDTLKVTYIDQPFPVTQLFLSIQKAFGGLATGFFISYAFLLISDSQIQVIIRERQNNIKHQIMVSGSSLSAYWLGNYFGDVIFQLFTCLTAIVFMRIFQINVPYAWLFFIINLFANPVFVYAVSFFFDRDEAGSLAIKVIYFIFGIIAPITIQVLELINDTTKSVAKGLRWIFQLTPIYCLSEGYQKIAQQDIVKIAIDISADGGPLSWEVAGQQLFFIILAIPLYWFVIYFFEKKPCGSLKKIKFGTSNRLQVLQQHENYEFNANDDIQEEALRVRNSNLLQPVRVNEVQKRYENTYAVKNVSFGLEFGECFALLGVSGAGKTTLFKCLTGEVYPSSGQLTIFGFNVTTPEGFAQARKKIGYCPQFDCIFQNVTVREHLEIYATLKGIKSNILQRLVEKVIEEMDLKDFVNVFANNLSGGNKRKLSVAIAIIGNPPLIFLDEPSTGVDPQAKRFMWNILSKISTLRKKSAVIITTHSMEEAEALCTKMGIMVAGEFRCFGSSTHIKDKYGTGYELEVKIRTQTEEEVQQIIQNSRQYLPFTLETFKDFLIANDNHGIAEELTPVGLGSEIYDRLFSGVNIDPAELIRWQFTEQQGNNAVDFLEPMFKEFNVLEHYGSAWKIKVSRDNYSIGYLFGMMEENQKKFNISEYSVAQTTLEQIFNMFAMEADQKNKNNKRRLSEKKKL